MNETTPDDEPEHIGRTSWTWFAPLRPRASRPQYDFGGLHCDVETTRLLVYLQSISNTALSFEPSNKPAPVAELTSLTDDTPPSPLGLDGVFYVYEP